jgi:peptidoglycan/xylan/chitin deacetylase (PgdA/CDA1 family)
MHGINPLPTWNPSASIRVSFALHGLALATLIIKPDLWAWVLATLLGNHLVLAVFGLWPTCCYLGRNWIHLPESARRRNEIALTFDDGPDPEVTPRILEILDRYQAKATFFVIGARALQYPELCRETARRGHTIANHSQHHKNGFAWLGWSGLMQEILQAQQTIKLITGQESRLFRAPMGIRNPILDPVLSRVGLPLVTWNQRGYDTRCRNSETLLKRLTRTLAAGDIVLLHDGNGAVDLSGQPVILEVLPRLLDIIANKGLKTIALHDVLAEYQNSLERQ